MPVDIKEPILNYWYRALHSPEGIELIATDFDAVRQKLYMARREARDPDLDNLSICASPFDPDRLWIVKRTR